MVHGHYLNKCVLVSVILAVNTHGGIILMTYIAPVQVIVTGSSVTQHAGEDYTLTCTVSGGETTTTTYQWHRNNLPLSGEISATLSFTPLRQTTPSSNGQYVCEAMRSSKNGRSGAFTIAVTSKFCSSELLVITVIMLRPQHHL